MRRATRTPCLALLLVALVALLALAAWPASAAPRLGTVQAVPPAVAGEVPQSQDRPLGCDASALPKPKIAIDVLVTRKPPIDRSMNAQQLTYVARQLGSQHSQAGRVLGLTKVRFSYRIGPMRFVAAMDGSTLCLHPSSIKITLQAAQDILIATGSDAGSCWDKAILEHEMEHVGFNNQAVRRAAGLLPSRLLTASAIVHGNDTQRLAQAMSKTISDIVAQTLTESVDAARIHHAELDAPDNQNGKRLRARCSR